jgi:membrane associated rhomboid family serine protease
MFFIPYSTQERTARQSFPTVNVLIVMINVVVFILETSILLTRGRPAFENFINTYSFVPASLHDTFFPLTILSAMFLHAGLLHIVGNMLYLLPFGDNVEDRLGHFKYLLFYLVCGIAATLIFALFNQGSTVPLLGASGAIAGVLGGYLVLNPTGSTVKGFIFLIILLFRVDLPAILFIGYWFVIQLFSSVASLGSASFAESGGVAFLAHVAGFVVGAILAPLLASRKNFQYRTDNAYPDNKYHL